MNSETEHEAKVVGAVAARWWALVVRGIAAILFGLLAMVSPQSSLLVLVVLWGAYALVDGIFNLVSSVRRGRAERSWGWLLIEGVMSVAAGVLTLARPGMTAMALLIVIAIWAVATGMAQLVAAIRLRRQIRGEWLLATSGLLSIVFGLFLLRFPGSGALALVWIIGAYAMVFGALLIGLGLRLHRWRRRGEPPGITTAGTPSAA